MSVHEGTTRGEKATSAEESAEIGRLPPPTAPSRAVVEVVSPVVDGGQFAAKGELTTPVVVAADVFLDGHDHPDASLWSRRAKRDRAGCRGIEQWVEVPMEPLGNDRWQARFVPGALGLWQFRVTGWHARWSSWRSATQLKVAAGQDVRVELAHGAELADELGEALQQMLNDDGSRPSQLAAHAARVRAAADDLRTGRVGDWLTDVELSELMRRYLPRDPVAISRVYDVCVEPQLARFSAWYEFFPRSTIEGPADDTRTVNGRGTLALARERLDYIAGLGFDVVYVPPIHPIGRAFRKGRNNSVNADPDDVGSPWAIGSDDGGHTAVALELGTVDDVIALAKACDERGMHLALDLAFQCSPDHPWVREHPEWFAHRADGTIQYAENPPKKYQDIYPLNFESAAWKELWEALAGVVEFWIDAGITVFRVDNPHTKPFAFWEWLIPAVKARHPAVIFLAEAFSRPRVMERLAKIGFSQSYTYFTWRQSRWELVDYFTDLVSRTLAYFRPNAWPNTPDILTEQLQHGGRPAFAGRAILAATLSPSWGIYGPAFELVETTAVREGSEEYLDSEKYELRTWPLDQPHSLAPLLGRLNDIRRRHPALQFLSGLRFHRTENDGLLCFTKIDPDGTDRVLVIVNLDPYHAHSGWVDVDLAAIDVPYEARYRLHDELGGGTYEWEGARGWVWLDPHGLGAHIFNVEPLVPVGMPGPVGGTSAGEAR